MIYDSVVPGLHRRQFKHKECYYLYYRTRAGIQRRPKIGDVGAMSINQARRIAKDLLTKVSMGGDPSLDFKNSKTEFTVNEAFDLMPRREDGWDKEVGRLFTKHISPVFGSLKLTQVLNDKVDTWHKSFAHQTSANRCLAVLSRIFTFAQKKSWIATNPCKHVMRFEEISRERYASKDEIAHIGKILEREAAHNPRSVAFLYLLIFTGSRPRAIEQSTWDQVEMRGDVGILKFQGKTGREKVVIPPQAMRLLLTLPRADTITGMKMPRRLWGKIKKEVGCKDLWARDWRRTFSTIGISTGQSLDLLAKALNHSTDTAANIYAKVTEDAQIKMVEEIAKLMDKYLRAS